MKILFVSPMLPFPLHSGGQTRSFSLIKGLAKRGHRITLFSFVRSLDEKKFVPQMEKYCQEVRVFKRRPVWSLVNLGLAIFSPLPFAAALYFSPGVKRAITEKLKEESFDILHFESFYTAPVLVENGNFKTVLGEENIEYLIYQAYIAQKRFFPFRLCLDFDIWKMRWFEKKMWERVDRVLALSQRDAEIIEKATRKPCPVIYNGVDIDYFSQVVPKPHCQPTILFIGIFKYLANQNAVEFLVSQIWPQVLKKLPEAKLWLVGKSPTPKIKSFVSRSVIVDDKVEDVRMAYANSDILVAPLRIASGSQIKILEAMASCVPVVTTSLCAEGIEAKHGAHVLVADRPEEFVDCMIRLLEDQSLHRKLTTQARKLVEEKYSWEKIIDKLEKVYQSLLNEKS